MKTCDCAEKGINNCNCKEIAETELRRKLDLLLRYAPAASLWRVLPTHRAS